MKLRFITFAHIQEAVKYLVSGKDGDHLPYTDESGTPNHRLMGAAWAALHGGYRGNKYEGPSKAVAIKKLKALYKSEGMDMPAESLSLEGDFFEEALAQSDSYDSIRSRVQTALDKAVRMGQDMDLDGDDDSMTGCYCWVRDLFPGTVVYSMNGDLFQCDYTDDGETVTLGKPVEVEMSYTPVGESAVQTHQRRFTSEVTQLQESTYDASKGELNLTVIKPGMSGNKRFYPAEVLKRSVNLFKGAKMFADHQSERENRERPEGSVNNWVANVREAWADADGTIKATATVIDPQFKAKLDRLNEAKMLNQMGVSIRAVAEAHPAKGSDGEAYVMVESLIAARSVDFVTYAGAGGQVEAMESQNDQFDVDVIGIEELRERRPDLIELIESSAQNKGANVKSLETQLQEATTALAAQKDRADKAEAKVAESEKAAKKATVQAELTKMLSESKLPEVAQKRIREQYKEATEVAGIKESIDAEKEYIKTLGGPTLVKGLGREQNGTQESGEKDHRATLVESFKTAGLTEEQAKIAAAGR